MWCFPPNFDARPILMRFLYYRRNCLVVMTICLVIAARPSWIEKGFSLTARQIVCFSQMARFCSRCNGLCTLLCERHFRSDPKTYLDASKTTEKEMLADPAFWDLVWSMSRTVAKESSVWLTWIALILVLLCLTKKIPYKTLVKNPFCFAWVFIF